MFKVLVEVSARHIHLSQECLDQLFGQGYKIKKLKDLSQPGLFAAQETLIVQTAKNKFDKVRIIGPTRPQTQAEISKSDAYYLGINPPIRKSGNLAGSEKCKLIGPKGDIDLAEGVIIAQRHLHLDLQTAEQNNLKDGQFVSVKIDSANRATTLHRVLVRVSSDFRPAVHLDTDEGNTAGVDKEIQGEIVNNEK